MEHLTRNYYPIISHWPWLFSLLIKFPEDTVPLPSIRPVKALGEKVLTFPDNKKKGVGSRSVDMDNEQICSSKKSGEKRVSGVVTHCASGLLDTQHGIIVTGSSHSPENRLS